MILRICLVISLMGVEGRRKYIMEKDITFGN